MRWSAARGRRGTTDIELGFGGPTNKNAVAAVVVEHRRQAIGRALIEETRRHMGERSMLVLLAAPAARDYYPALGFSPVPSAWLVRATEPLT